VWDTVGALGIPGIFNFVGKDLYQFHDVKLSRIIENAYHALAIDERRQPFQPALWEQNEDAVGQTLEQVWFAGVHSNVGGGYSECGLSDIAFDWMARKAQACDLALDQDYIKQHIDPKYTGELRNSMTLLYRVFGRGDRAIGTKPEYKEKVHKSAIDRMKSANLKYGPQNLISYQKSPKFELAE
jgi:uncharacterized protein (DUF2235 family)